VRFIAEEKSSREIKRKIYASRKNYNPYNPPARNTHSHTRAYTMNEQQQLDALKRRMAETMSAMEVEALELQQRLHRKQELSKTNEEMGISRIALEYKVEELEINIPYPPDFSLYPESSDDEDDQSHIRRRHEPPQVQEAKELARKERIRGHLIESVKVMKQIRLEAFQKYREFEMTRLKELGQEGWTLRSVVEVAFPDPGVLEEDKLRKKEGWTNLYYFSRPL